MLGGASFPGSNLPFPRWGVARARGGVGWGVEWEAERLVEEGGGPRNQEETEVGCAGQRIQGADWGWGLRAAQPSTNSVACAPPPPAPSEFHQPHLEE